MTTVKLLEGDFDPDVMYGAGSCSKQYGSVRYSTSPQYICWAYAIHGKDFYVMVDSGDKPFWQEELSMAQGDLQSWFVG